jgi:cytochrome P450
MTEFGFGVPSGLLTDSADRYILDLLHINLKKLGVFEQWPSLSHIGFGDVASYLLAITPFSAASLAIRRFTQWHHDFIYQAIMNNSETVSGILGAVIQSGQGKLARRGHNKAQMVAEGSFVTFTAADGNGTTLSGVMHYLAHYPRVYRKLADELRGRFTQRQAITWGPELASCEYLRACLNEAWRLVPPACGVHWRECKRPGIVIGDGEIPVGCDVGMSLFTVFRSERYFCNPLEFWPERWIKGVVPEAEYAVAKQMFTPFSVGPRSCAGSHVAVMVASVSIANLLVHFDFRLAGTNDDGLDARQDEGQDHGQYLGKVLEFESHFTLPSWEKGPMLQFRERR